MIPSQSGGFARVRWAVPALVVGSVAALSGCSASVRDGFYSTRAYVAAGSPGDGTTIASVNESTLLARTRSANALAGGGSR